MHITFAYLIDPPEAREAGNEGPRDVPETGSVPMVREVDENAKERR